MNDKINILQIIYIIAFWFIIGSVFFYGTLILFEVNYSHWQVIVVFLWLLTCIFITIRVIRNEGKHRHNIIKIFEDN